LARHEIFRFWLETARTKSSFCEPTSDHPNVCGQNLCRCAGGGGFEVLDQRAAVAMERSRFTEERITGVLKEHEPGPKTADLVCKHGVSEATFHNWKSNTAAWMSPRPSG
jgi:hypothetical protein